MKKKKQQKFSKVTKFLFTVFLILLLTFAASASYVYVMYTNGIKAVDTNENKVVFIVKSGSTVQQVATELKDQNLIKDRRMFNLYARVNKLTDIKAGLFELSSSMSADEVLRTITDDSKAIIDQVAVQLTEGFWAKQMAAEFEDKLGIDKQELLDLWNSKEFINELKADYWFITDEILTNKAAKVLLEGYLYPDTYFFFKGSNAEQVTYKLLDRFDEVMTPWKDKIAGTEFTLNEMLTLASIVQFESGSYEEMPKIAGVFMNRLHDDMMLQSSVTVCYAIYNYTNWEECESADNAKIDSPYNTYKVVGLPPGPIMNPSYHAIEAVIEYTKHDYYYFLNDVDGDGSVYYAATYEEHLKNVDKYLR
jgi:UPF0755 protein